ncbi:MAG: hypothetical protein LBP59_11040 [Planctomycetaceae bacterium]|jgi:hypothetical protein|nr:hypothetical protein [Planctomycetaceae bacterium]
MDESNKASQVVTIVIVILVGVLVGWNLSNLYNRNQASSNDYKASAQNILRDIELTSSQLELLIDEQVKACKAKGINVFITKPIILQESIGIETSISVKIKYMNWQIEITLALGRMLHSTNPYPNPKPRPGSTGSVGTSEYGDSLPSLPKGLSIR